MCQWKRSSVCVMPIMLFSLIAEQHSLANQTETARLISAQQQVMAEFGRAISVDGVRVAISAPGSYGSAWSNDAVYLFEQTESGWIQTDRLFPSQASSADYVGASVSLHGDWLAIGSPLNDQVAANSGAVAVYERVVSGWLERAWLKASDPGLHNQFGTSVGIDPEWLAVGAVWKNVSAEQSGAVYVFHYEDDQWVESAILDSGAGIDYEHFGQDIDLDSGRLLVGSSALYAPGAAYMFEYDGVDWSLEAVLTPSVYNDQDHFGQSVSLDGETAVIGAPMSDRSMPDAGAVYCFEYSEGVWIETQSILHDSAQADDRFGHAVSLDADLLLAGAPYSDHASPNSGTVLVYMQNSGIWTIRDRLTPSDPLYNDYFGLEIALGGHNAFCGSPFKDGSLQDSGLVYLFDLDDPSTPVPTATPVQTPSPTPLPGYYYWTGVFTVRSAAGGHDAIEGARIQCRTMGNTEECTTDAIGRCSITIWAHDTLLIDLGVTAPGYTDFTDSIQPWPQERLVEIFMTPDATPTPDASPSATPGSSPSRVALSMPSHFFRGGDLCRCDVSAILSPEDNDGAIQLYVILDCFGFYYFAPSFGDEDVFISEVLTGSGQWTVVDDFVWPGGCGAVSGLRWISAMTDAQSTRIIGEWDEWEFGWAD